MKLRITDRILVFLAGIVLLTVCAGIVGQLFFGLDLAELTGQLFSGDTPGARAVLILIALLFLALGGYCVLLLFRHRGRKDKFVLQKNENGELAISIHALENMVRKCLDQHEEIHAEKLSLEPRKDGILIRIEGDVAGGISIPLTVEALQKQIRQYVTACSGVEVQGILVQIDESREDAADAPFSIAAPSARPLLRDTEENSATSEPAAPSSEASVAAGAVPPQTVEPVPAEKPSPAEMAVPPVPPVAPVPPVPVVDEEDDRPLHQRLFSPQPQACFVPEPPEGAEAPADAAVAPADAAETPADAAEAPEAVPNERGASGTTDPGMDIGKEIPLEDSENWEVPENSEIQEDPEESENREVPENSENQEAPEESENREAPEDIPEKVDVPEAGKETQEAAAHAGADKEYLESLKAFDDALTGLNREEKSHE